MDCVIRLQFVSLFSKSVLTRGRKLQEMSSSSVGKIMGRPYREHRSSTNKYRDVLVFPLSVSGYSLVTVGIGKNIGKKHDVFRSKLETRD